MPISVTKCSGKFLSCQQVMSFVMFWGQIQNYMMRININLLIVAMVVTINTSDKTKESTRCGYERMEINGTFGNASSQGNTTTSGAAEDSPDLSPRFPWSEVDQGWVLGGFYWGYATTQIVGGRLAEKFGMKVVYGTSLLATAILTFLSPLTARLGLPYFVALRVILGIFEGPTFPSLHTMTARWVEPNNRSSFIARTYFGSVFGVIITYPLCGLITDKYGWEAAFYVIGGITMLWFLTFAAIVYDSPDKHPFISHKERVRLTDAIKAENKPVVTNGPTPWRQILTSKPFLGVLMADFTNGLGLGVFFMVSKYLKAVHGTDIKSNGFMSALPFLCRYIGGVFTAKISDTLIQKGYITRTAGRKIFNSVAAFGPALCMVVIIFVKPSSDNDNTVFIMSMLCLGAFCNGSISSGHFTSHVDLAPNYAATLLGICNTVSCLLGFVKQLAIGHLLDMCSLSVVNRWNVLFGLAAGCYTLGNIGYICLVTAEPQPWNNPEEAKVHEEEELQTLKGQKVDLKE